MNRHTTTARPRLLLVYIQPSSFVRDDLEILSARYDVRCFHFGSTTYASSLGRLWGLLSFGIKQFFWLLRELRHAQVVVGWFVDYHLVLPVALARWYGKPVAVMVAGFDAIVLRELGYGVFTSTWRAPLARFVAKRASIILPVSESLVASENRYSSWPDRRRYGIQAYVPDLSTPAEVVPFGYVSEHWPMGPEARGPVVCTVGLIDEERTFRRKGIDLFIEAARRVPEARFQVIGISDRMREHVEQSHLPPANLELIGPQPRDQLPGIYGAAAVYAQLSRAEGLPNVLCEAMMCGCMPVGSAVFGIVDAIDAVGFLVEEPDPDQIAAAVRQALAAPPEARAAVRQHMVSQFSRDRRQAHLFQILERIATVSTGA